MTRCGVMRGRRDALQPFRETCCTFLTVDALFTVRSRSRRSPLSQPAARETSPHSRRQRTATSRRFRESTAIHVPCATATAQRIPCGPLCPISQARRSRRVAQQVARQDSADLVAQTRSTTSEFGFRLLLLCRPSSRANYKGPSCPVRLLEQSRHGATGLECRFDPQNAGSTAQRPTDSFRRRTARNNSQGKSLARPDVPGVDAWQISGRGGTCQEFTSEGPRPSINSTMP